MAPAVLFDQGQIESAVVRVGSEISRDHPEGVLLVAVLKGSVMFLADLVRAVDVPVTVDFLAISRFAPDSGRVRIVKDLEGDIAGLDVVLVEDIVDTGLTATFLLGHLRALTPKRVRVCTLLDRARRRIVPVDVDYRGFELEDDFVLGYGLDFQERYRNLDRIITVDPRPLADDPDLHVGELFAPERP
ncbi:MAG: hypoxanthine phosphoribosyltransferase [Actinobacteria bacterium]|nr:hypoxanthine phosphoribosyltransferase [Actinomycetota bacterium]